MLPLYSLDVVCWHATEAGSCREDVIDPKTNEVKDYIVVGPEVGAGWGAWGAAVVP